MNSINKIAFTAICLISSSAMAVTISGTKHDLSDETNDNGQICVYCHTPHTAANESSPPLWNRADPTGDYTMYNSTFSGTIDMSIGTAPGAESMVCLSCHDGAIALDTIANAPNKGWTTTGRIISSTGFARMGKDLRSEHPIAITYSAGTGTNQDPDFKTTPDSALVKLYGTNRVECASCHDVHDNQYEPFLRSSNDNSAMCLACHDK